MWTELPCTNFHLLLCCAILESEKQQIMEKRYGFNEILKVVIPLIQILVSWLFYLVVLIYRTFPWNIIKSLE